MNDQFRRIQYRHHVGAIKSEIRTVEDEIRSGVALVKRKLENTELRIITSTTKAVKK